MTPKRLRVVWVAIFVISFAWAFVAPSWWQPAYILLPLGVVAAVLLLRAALGQAAGNRAHRASAVDAEEDLAVDREIKASLTDEGLAWAVVTWRKSHL
ncbi:hypothetical protein [Mycolicibacterium neoaurum]|uniref:hypothetical protein n=1 Tax=Mycolicibacterium neoaurum TaxID=1795 RepID=UPI001F4C6B2F|nr:hypothetical protein [Mycolicibacterium neoaurum]